MIHHFRKGLSPLFFIVLIMLLNHKLYSQAIELNWNPNLEKDIKYYVIYRDTTSSPEIEISNVPAADTTYIDNDIVIGQKYYYRIAAVDSADNLSEFSDDVLIIAQYPTPIELVSFSVKFINNKIELKWFTAPENNNLGFEIQKSNDGISFNKICFISGLGTSVSPHSYNFLDSDISYGKYYYRLKQINTDGSFKYSDIIAVEVDIPEKFELSQNYPNPFNPETTIKYVLAEEGKVSLIILDVLGREVRKLIDEYKNAGYYTVKWDGKDNYGNIVSTGIYFCKIKGEGFSMMKKIMLTR